jgi:DNA-binding response OmpR family regulator
MATSNHRVLVVEDDVPTRDELTEVLRTLDFDVVGCGDKETALRHLNEQAFCMALVDLQVFRDPESIRPMEVHGHALIQEIRKKYPERHSPMDWRFPVLVVSGFAREGTESKEVIREGASDIVWKLPSGGLAAELSRKIQEQLRASGREDHANCAASSARTPDLELSIPAIREKRRTEVTLGGRSALLPDRLLKVLLHLIKGRLSDLHVHNIDMGFNGLGGFKLPAELDNAMRASFPVGTTRITKNHYNGYYSLIDTVTIGAIEIDALVAHGDSGVAELARAIQVLRSRSDGNS